jgi:hypothetical protein
MKIVAYPHFYARNTIALLFFHENFWQNEKNNFFQKFIGFFYARNARLKKASIKNFIENDSLNLYLYIFASIHTSLSRIKVRKAFSRSGNALL